VSFAEKTNTISIRADNCTGSSASIKLPCRSCESLPQSLKFQDFIKRATEAAEFTNWDYLNSQQLKALLKKLSGACHELQTKVTILILFIFSGLTSFQLTNAKRHTATADRKIADHKRILMLLSSNDIAGLRHLLAAALQRGASYNQNTPSPRDSIGRSPQFQI
jgi:hypothetical protein